MNHLRTSLRATAATDAVMSPAKASSKRIMRCGPVRYVRRRSSLLSTLHASRIGVGTFPRDIRDGLLCLMRASIAEPVASYAGLWAASRGRGVQKF
jgi:hypothetical protein